jgi:hypothetical protein
MPKIKARKEAPVSKIQRMKVEFVVESARAEEIYIFEDPSACEKIPNAFRPFNSTVNVQLTTNL